MLSECIISKPECTAYTAEAVSRKDQQEHSDQRETQGGGRVQTMSSQVSLS